MTADPNHEQGRYGHAVTLAQIGHLDAVLDRCDEAIRRNPADAKWVTLRDAVDAERTRQLGPRRAI